eukprot:TRINITY_DN1810_c0_g1_i7.p1 TRINITY_DN1810_c0_g1~~TRINITY_DN1810_c0_g1_i7.p1  ORF type:complete len:370 (-),score=73.33 TRINITY_DN1810_c0_g1_i7:133-1242(-)
MASLSWLLLLLTVCLPTHAEQCPTLFDNTEYKPQNCEAPRTAVLLTGDALKTSSNWPQLFNLIKKLKNADVYAAFWGDEEAGTALRVAFSLEGQRAWFSPPEDARGLIRETYSCYPECFDGPGGADEETVLSELYLAHKAWSLLHDVEPEDYDVVVRLRLDMIQEGKKKGLQFPCPMLSNTLYTTDFMPNHAHGRVQALPPTQAVNISMPVDSRFAFGSSDVMEEYCTVYTKVKSIMEAEPLYWGKTCGIQKNSNRVALSAANILGMQLFRRWELVKWREFVYTLMAPPPALTVLGEGTSQEKELAVKTLVGILLCGALLVGLLVARWRLRKNRLEAEYSLVSRSDDGLELEPEPVSYTHLTLPTKRIV